MEGNKLKENKKIIIGGITLLVIILLSGYYFLNKAEKFSNDKNNTEQATSETNQGTKKEENTETNIASENISYEIKDLNQKDGDIFSIPENVKFTVEPKAEKVRISLFSSSQAVLYKKELSENNIDLNIYPDSKLKEGSEGTLLIEILVSDKVVTAKSVKVVF